MKQIIILLINLPLLLIAQENHKGIQFVQGLSWEQIKERAKIENKYIFIDCYATWCRPCKEMDRFVYSQDEVGIALNSRFISVKIQMDTNKNDDDNIKQLYAAAREIEKKYKIVALPTFLFFSPTGEPVHENIGSKTARQFIELARDAVTPKKQFFTLLNTWKSGKLDCSAMPALLETLNSFKEDSLKLDLARDYMHLYLDKLPNDSFFKKQNIDFFYSYSRMLTPKDRIFQLYYTHPNIIDKIVLQKGYAKDRVNYIITHTEIEPYYNYAFKNGITPDWKSIYINIKNKYSKEYAITNLLDAQLKWYYAMKQWENWLRIANESWKSRKKDFTKYGWMQLNDLCWTVCAHSNNKKILKTALKWADIGISNTEKPEVPLLDTKANILYKIGKKKEAKSIVSLIVEIFKKQLTTATNDLDKKYLPQYITYYEDVLYKMKMGDPIEIKD